MFITCRSGENDNKNKKQLQLIKYFSSVDAEELKSQIISCVLTPNNPHLDTLLAISGAKKLSLYKMHYQLQLLKFKDDIMSTEIYPPLFKLSDIITLVFDFYHSSSEIIRNVLGDTTWNWMHDGRNKNGEITFHKDGTLNAWGKSTWEVIAPKVIRCADIGHAGVHMLYFDDTYDTFHCTQRSQNGRRKGTKPSDSYRSTLQKLHKSLANTTWDWLHDGSNKNGEITFHKNGTLDAWGKSSWEVMAPNVVKCHDIGRCGRHMLYFDDAFETFHCTQRGQNGRRKNAKPSDSYLSTLESHRDLLNNTKWDWMHQPGRKNGEIILYDDGRLKTTWNESTWKVIAPKVVRCKNIGGAGVHNLYFDDTFENFHCTQRGQNGRLQ